MDLSFVPLLQTQRELYRMPGGLERFKAYLSTMVDGETGDLALPLVAMNPMGKDHVPDLLGHTDRASMPTPRAQPRWRRCRPCWAIGPGGSASASSWRMMRTGGGRIGIAPSSAIGSEGRALYRRGWVVGLVWTSESPTGAPSSRRSARSCIGSST